MPAAAARLADVGAADPHPAVALRRGQHLAEQLAVGLLDQGALGEGTVRFGDASGERVAHLLEPAEPEDARRPGGLDPVRHVHPPEPLGDEPGQLALELADLAPQLGPRPALIDRQPHVLCNPVGDKGHGLPFQYSRHKQILSRLEGRGGNP
ncbi:MAG: hypothetical protein JSS68_12200 [Actinobacteria bacterium]|nr:hypothetical protein [Actinomycetota bacterium]